MDSKRNAFGFLLWISVGSGKVPKRQYTGCYIVRRTSIYIVSTVAFKAEIFSTAIPLLFAKNSRYGPP